MRGATGWRPREDGGRRDRGAATAGAQTEVDDDFSEGTHDGTELVAGGLELSPLPDDFFEDFDGTALPSGWEMVPWETGGSATVGFLGSWTGSNPVPTAFTVNGTTCTAL